MSLKQRQHVKKKKRFKKKKERKVERCEREGVEAMTLMFSFFYTPQRKPARGFRVGN